MEMEFFSALLSIIMINLVLSGDNAVVIALASRSLPSSQQKKAIFWGTFGAIALRVILTVVAVWLLQIPLLQAAGALLLLWIAVKLLAPHEETEDVAAANNLIEAIKTIIIADFVMSLDNVLAIAGAAQGNLLLVVLGIAISIPIIIGGSQIIMSLMNRFPIIVVIGAGILGWTAGEMIVNDRVLHPYILQALGNKEIIIPIALTIFVIAVGKLMARKVQRESAEKAFHKLN